MLSYQTPSYSKCFEMIISPQAPLCFHFIFSSKFILKFCYNVGLLKFVNITCQRLVAPSTNLNLSCHFLRYT